VTDAVLGSNQRKSPLELSTSTFSGFEPLFENSAKNRVQVIGFEVVTNVSGFQ